MKTLSKPTSPKSMVFISMLESERVSCGIETGTTNIRPTCQTVLAFEKGQSV